MYLAKAPNPVSITVPATGSTPGDVRALAAAAGQTQPGTSDVLFIGNPSAASLLLRFQESGQTAPTSSDMTTDLGWTHIIGPRADRDIRLTKGFDLYIINDSVATTTAIVQPGCTNEPV